MSAGPVRRMLIAVDDSIESLAAARAGARFAVSWGAAVRVINVIADEQREKMSRGLLEHVVRDVCRQGVAADGVDTVVRIGEPFRRILEEAGAWHADLIVMAVSNRVGLRSPYIGSATEHVLEFATVPVLVIPSGGGVR